MEETTTMMPEGIEVSLTKSELTLTDPVACATATVLPEGAEAEALEWYSTDPYVCEVDEFGTLTAKAYGVAVIVCQCGEVSGSAAVEVKATYQQLGRLDIGLKSDVMEVGGVNAAWLSGTKAVHPDYELSWLSSDPAVAAIDARGVVRAHKTGVITLTAAIDGLTVASRVLSVSASAVLPIEPVLVGGDATIALPVGASMQLLAPPQGVTLSARYSKEGVCELDDSGRLTARAPGRTNVTVWTRGGKAVASVCVVKAERVIEGPATYQIGNTFTHEQLLEQLPELSFDSENDCWQPIVSPCVAWNQSAGRYTVNANGAFYLPLVRPGHRVWLVRLQTSKLPVERVTLSVDRPYVLRDELVQFSVEIEPQNADKGATDVVITCDGAPVGNNACWPATQPGEHEIVATVGGVSASLTLQVYEKLGLTVELPQGQPFVGQSMPIVATLGDGAAAEIDHWMVDDETIAGVAYNEQGEPVLTAHAAGTATVTAMGNGWSGKLTVKVRPEVQFSISAAPTARIRDFVMLTVDITSPDDGEELPQPVIRFEGGIAVYQPDSGSFVPCEQGTITVIAELGGKTASTVVTVSGGGPRFQFGPELVYADNETQLHALNPSDLTETPVVWECLTPGASVTSGGVLTLTDKALTEVAIIDRWGVEPNLKRFAIKRGRLVSTVTGGTAISKSPELVQHQFYGITVAGPCQLLWSERNSTGASVW